MRNTFSIIIILLFIFTIPFVGLSQIKVFESEISDSTNYDNGINDTIFIVYKGENNKSTIKIKNITIQIGMDILLRYAPQNSSYLVRYE